MATPRTGRPVGRPAKNKSNDSTFKKSSVVQALKNANIEDIPEIPEHLQEAGRERWVWAWAVLDWLKPSDYFVVLEMCEAYDELQLVEASLKLRGSNFYTMPNGIITEHPLYKQKKDLQVNLNGKQSALGMTPQARNSLALTTSEMAELKGLLEGMAQMGVERDV